MIILILSDIHGNLEALDAVLKTKQALSPDRTICLGDIVGYGANPNDCIERIRAECDVVLLGNHDAAVFSPTISQYFNPFARASVMWTGQQIAPENLSYLQTLPLIHRQESLLFVHSSPKHPEEWDYIITDADAREALTAFSEQVCFIGHSHTPGIFTEKGPRKTLHRGERAIVNVGSVGQPRDGVKDAAFGVFDTERWEYRLIRVSYDVGGAATKIREAGLPSQLADRLYYGR